MNQNQMITYQNMYHHPNRPGRPNRPNYRPNNNYGFIFPFALGALTATVINPYYPPYYRPYYPYPPYYYY